MLVLAFFVRMCHVCVTGLCYVIMCQVIVQCDYMSHDFVISLLFNWSNIYT